MQPSTFQAYKLTGATLAFLLASLGQWLAPYRGQWRLNWLNAKTNFGLGLVGALFTGTLCGGCACLLAQKAAVVGFGVFHWLAVPLTLQIACTIFILDLTAFVWHRANHAAPFLWRFHAVHHSDSVFESSTAIRFHPGELIASLGVRLLVVACFGIPVLGLLIFELIYTFFNFFEHGDIKLPLSFELAWAKIFISPALHRKHHSRISAELNTNFGTIFSIWDQIFGTSRQSSSNENIQVGLPGKAPRKGVGDLLLFPARAQSR